MLYKEAPDCRLCMDSRLVDVLDLGDQGLTGVFPKTSSENVPSGPLRLCKCVACNLVQLRHNYDLSRLYGENYGYRSGLNQSMVQHLQKKVEKILATVQLDKGDLVVDIGSNDSTLLQAYPDSLTLVGVDPSGPKFKRFYPPHVQLIPDFFSTKLVQEKFPGRRAKVITSIAMFYDLERPQSFVDEISSLLDDQGVWVFEQSYLPFMLETNSYDTICHEHLEYYALQQIKRMTDHAGLKIVDIEFNDVNGGSFSITASRRGASYPEAGALIADTLAKEERLGLAGSDTYRRFAHTAVEHRDELVRCLTDLKRAGRKVMGYGASTKGNVLIQFCRLDTNLMSSIAEVNPDKFGAYTPGTKIPIVSEEDARATNPDYFLVFPWHFRAGILKREQAFLKSGGRLIFPLPSIDIVSADGVQSVWRNR